MTVAASSLDQDVWKVVASTLPDTIRTPVERAHWRSELAPLCDNLLWCGLGIRISAIRNCFVSVFKDY
jgi:hypothetical protein